MVTKYLKHFLNPLVYESIEYPSSDGQRMSEDTLQFDWIARIKNGLETMYSQEENVFVAGDLLWYPLKGRPDIRMAPDVMVVLGRLKGDRLSWMQFFEDNIAPQVVFEVLSHCYRPDEMARKFGFFQVHDVQEYYIYNPHQGTLEGMIRHNDNLQDIENMLGWRSPLLGIYFGLADKHLKLTFDDGTPFMSYSELYRLYKEESRKQRARAEVEHRRVEKYEKQLRALGIEPDEINGA